MFNEYSRTYRVKKLASETVLHNSTPKIVTCKTIFCKYPVLLPSSSAHKVPKLAYHPCFTQYFLARSRVCVKFKCALLCGSTVNVKQIIMSLVGCSWSLLVILNVYNLCCICLNKDTNRRYLIRWSTCHLLPNFRKICYLRIHFCIHLKLAIRELVIRETCLLSVFK